VFKRDIAFGILIHILEGLREVIEIFSASFK
jgi:hypothetical protein